MEIYFPIITDNSYLNGQVGVDRRYRISLYFIFMRKALFRYESSFLGFLKPRPKLTFGYD
ncbi:hypothetical protein EZJ55_05180 [Microcystis aeruginosa EAWAG127a]|uniref:Uncharacterized protein n=1 Tax=Microcystis aeruginosa EAWAG127a TaxID=2529855 RepID=A0A5J5LRS5_MICAE|nr:hypothetical protein EZJ55_05180 [Microcystis aeruginosa EAWAG127a]